jgi:hypothetical protein
VHPGPVSRCTPRRPSRSHATSPDTRALPLPDDRPWVAPGNAYRRQQPSNAPPLTILQRSWLTRSTLLSSRPAAHALTSSWDACRAWSGQRCADVWERTPAVTCGVRPALRMLNISLLVTLAIAKDARAEGMTGEECPTTMTSRIKEEPVHGRAEAARASPRDNQPRASCRRTIFVDHGFLAPPPSTETCSMLTAARHGIASR